MRKTRNNLHKGSKVLVAVLLTLGLIFIVVRRELNKAYLALIQKEHKDYISLEYIPSQKKLTGKWPSELNDLPNYIRAEKEHTTAGYVIERLDRVLKFHTENYRSLKPLHSDSNDYTFIIHLKDQSEEADATIRDN